MFKLCHQIIQKIKEYYFEYIKYKTENDEIKELENILNYLFKIDYYITPKSYYEQYFNQHNTLYVEIKNINKISNNIIKLCSSSRIEYLNNLPLHLKWLSYDKINCNLPPNIIYLVCIYCDIHNLPKYLKFMLIITKFNNTTLPKFPNTLPNEILFIDNTINESIKHKIFNLLYDYYDNILFYNLTIHNWYSNYDTF